MKHVNVKHHTITFKTSCGRNISNHHIVAIEDALKGTAWDIRFFGDQPDTSREHLGQTLVRKGLEAREAAEDKGTFRYHIVRAWLAIWS